MLRPGSPDDDNRMSKLDLRRPSSMIAIVGFDRYLVSHASGLDATQTLKIPPSAFEPHAKWSVRSLQAAGEITERTFTRSRIGFNSKAPGRFAIVSSSSEY